MHNATPSPAPAQPTGRDRDLLATCLEVLSQIPDHRKRRGRVYPLQSLLAILLLAVTADCNSPEDAAVFACDHADWLRQVGILDKRVPSAQTLRRLLREMGSDLMAVLQPLVAQLREGMADAEGGSACALDGKALRGAADPEQGRCGSHIVSAWCETGLTVAQEAVADKDNELTAMRRLLADLALAGRIVTIDAQGCYTDVAGTIAEGDGFYLLAVKDNQPSLHAALKKAFSRGKGTLPQKSHRSRERKHGRQETRVCTVADGRAILDELDPAHRWRDLATVVCVQAHRTVKGKTTQSLRYYISNLPYTTTAARMATLIRGHWGIENSLHWVLDDTCQEDRSRLRTGNAARNMAAMRRMALNILTVLKRKLWPDVPIRRLRQKVNRTPWTLKAIMV